jgi:hypothetical protein
MPRARRPLGVLGAAPPAISRRESLPRRVGSRLKRRCDVATRRVARGPAHAGSRVAPAHRDASKAASASMASRLCLETGRLKAASWPRQRHGYSGGISLRRLWENNLAVICLVLFYGHFEPSSVL